MVGVDPAGGADGCGLGQLVAPARSRCRSLMLRHLWAKLFRFTGGTAWHSRSHAFVACLAKGLPEIANSVYLVASRTAPKPY